MEDLNKMITALRKISFNIPSPNLFPAPIEECELTPTEQRLYLQLSLEFQNVLDDAPSFQMGAYKWNQLLPERLQHYGLTVDAWERISTIGDSDEEIQNQLNQLLDQFEESD